MSGHIAVCSERDSNSGESRPGRSASIRFGVVNGRDDRCAQDLHDDQAGLVIASL